MLDFLKLAINVTIDLDGDGIAEIGVQNPDDLAEIAENAETDQERVER